MPKNLSKIDELSIAAIRSICIDGINKAKSGHPGMCLSAAPIIYTLYKDFLNSNPENSSWHDRDRFVMSCGHGSMLYYTMLHLCGFDVTIDDLKSFRQVGSRTPGHPEVGVTDGIDAGSGPLGQGIAQAVGMAMAETILNKMYGDDVYNHYTYCLTGDGCLEEGISQEAISFAGTNKLNKLILLYDKNDVTLDGPLAQSSNENVAERFLASNWNVIHVSDGNDYKSIRRAIKLARENACAPTIVIFDTVIGLGSKNQGTCKVHGSPLGKEDGDAAKLSYGYQYGEFEIPQEVYENFKNTFIKRGKQANELSNERLNEFAKKSPDKYKQFKTYLENDLDTVIDSLQFPVENFKDAASRDASGEILNFYHENIPVLVGGSADVAGSVKTALKNGKTWSVESRDGTNINWGIREFFMSAAANGMLLHGGLRSYVGSFFVFSDYCKPAIRMSALEELPQIYLFSHDSIAVGEDGPTHQPIEQLAMLRSIPNTYTFRPADYKEALGAYVCALKSKKTPSAIIISRQKLKLLENSSADNVAKGGYIVKKEDKNNNFTLIASGSEVQLAIDASNLLKEKGIDVRVVSIPCFELFEKQGEEYIESILGQKYENRLFIEMSSSFGLYKYAKNVMAIDKFGASGPANQVIELYGFTADKVCEKVLKLLNK
ncbi:MAG: transketolase [Bacilli bacterium]|nr:transketolase [Bacilli bacterium]